LAEFAINNKIYSTTKISPFITNYGRKLRMEVDIRIKEKMKKATEFAKRMKKIQEKAGAVLKRVQEEIKQQADRERKRIEVGKVEDKVMLSTLVFKERLTKKLVDQYVGPYTIDEVVSTNAVKL